MLSVVGGNDESGRSVSLAEGADECGPGVAGAEGARSRIEAVAGFGKAGPVPAGGGSSRRRARSRCRLGSIDGGGRRACPPRAGRGSPRESSGTEGGQHPPREFGGLGFAQGFGDRGVAEFVVFEAHDAVGDQGIGREPCEQLEYPRQVRSQPVGVELPSGEPGLIADGVADQLCLGYAAGAPLEACATSGAPVPAAFASNRRRNPRRARRAAGRSTCVRLSVRACPVVWWGRRAARRGLRANRVSFCARTATSWASGAAAAVMLTAYARGMGN